MNFKQDNDASALENSQNHKNRDNRDISIKQNKDADKSGESAENQYGYILEASSLADALARKLGRRPCFTVVNFGCQMNARDSEKLRGVLRDSGFEETENEDDADVVIYNTCTVRENADEHVYGRLGHLNGIKEKHPERLIGLCGCMMQERRIVEKIKKSYPFVDLIFGTHNLGEFPRLLVRALSEKKRVVEIIESKKTVEENLPVERKYSFKSGVNIMYGCNNFCSYCIVPYVRGREISRTPEAILAEVMKLRDDGVRKIMLLGQNVNSYGKGLEVPETFAGLLGRICRISGIDRVRFMTSHPKDLSQELIDAMAEYPAVCPHLHLPVQSGSTEILKRMNRHYTREDYLALVGRIREKIPDISLTTDIIVGFPGETEEDFKETLSLIREVGFDSAFTFIYSKRTGTPAAAMADQVPEEVVHERFDRLLAEVKKDAEARCARFKGRTMDVLVEEANKQPGLVTGRIPNNLVVHFPGSKELIGKIVPVRLDECRGFYYIGTAEETDGV